MSKFERTVNCLQTHLLSLSSSWEGALRMDEEVDSFIDDNWNAGTIESTQDTGQLNRMKQSSLGTVGFSWLRQFHLLLLSTDNSQFTIRVIVVQRLFRKGGKKKRLTFAWKCFFEIAIFRHSVVCSMIPKLFYFPPR